MINCTPRVQRVGTQRRPRSRRQQVHCQQQSRRKKVKENRNIICSLIYYTIQSVGVNVSKYSEPRPLLFKPECDDLLLESSVVGDVQYSIAVE